MPELPGVVWLLSASILLLFFRHLTTRVFIASLAVAIVFEVVDLDPRAFTQGYPFLPDVLRNLTHEAVLVMLTWIVAMGLLTQSLFRRQRSVDRVIMGVACFAVSSLLYGYHLIVINGDLLTTLKTEEVFLERSIKWESEAFNSLCETPGYDCIDGVHGGEFEYPSSAEIAKQVEDYLGFYRSRGHEAFAFTLSRGLSVADHPFAAAVWDDSEGFRAIISRERPLNWMNSTKNVFGIFSWAAQIFWISFALLTIALHQWMINKRKKRRQSAAASKADTA